MGFEDIIYFDTNFEHHNRRRKNLYPGIWKFLKIVCSCLSVGFEDRLGFQIYSIHAFIWSVLKFVFICLLKMENYEDT